MDKMTEKELKYVTKGSRVRIRTDLGEFEGTVTNYDVEMGIISVKNVVCVTNGKSLPKMMNFMKNEIITLSTVSLSKKKNDVAQRNGFPVAKTSSEPDDASTPPDTVGKISSLASKSLEKTDETFSSVCADGKNRTGSDFYMYPSTRYEPLPLSPKSSIKIWESPMVMLSRVLDMKEFVPTEQMLLGGVSSRQAEVLSGGFTSGRPPSNCVVLGAFCEDFREAVSAIKSTSAIGLAMFGENLGRGGRLGWVAISGKHHVFLFDVLSFGEKNLMTHLRTVFENENIVKVVHDCRVISYFLFHRHEIKFVNVFDTQVASVLVFRRKNGILPPSVDPLLACLFEHLSVPQETIYLQKELTQKFKENPQVWLQRPAPENLLQSAAFSVRHLNELRLRLMEEMLRDFIDGVDIYLGLYRDAEDKELDKLQNITHVLPTEFRNLEANAELSRQKRDELYGQDMSLGGAFRFAPTVDKFVADRQPAKDLTTGVTENVLSERGMEKPNLRLDPQNPDKELSPSAEPVSMYDILKLHRPAVPKNEDMVFLAAGSEPTLAVANERPKTLKSKLLPSSDTESNWQRRGRSLASSNPRQVDMFEDFSAIPSPERLCIGQCTLDSYARSYDDVVPLGKGINLEVSRSFGSGAPSKKLQKSDGIFDDNAENDDSSDSVSMSVSGSASSVASGGLAETLGTDIVSGYVRGTKTSSADFSGDDNQKENSCNSVSAYNGFQETCILVSDDKPLKGQVTDFTNNVQTSSSSRANGVQSLGRGSALMKLLEDSRPGKSFVKNHA